MSLPAATVDGARHRGRARRLPTIPVDWDLVRALRQQASKRLTEQLKDRPGISEEERRVEGRRLVSDMLRSHACATLAAGGTFTW